jgi:uncharacterized membrane protein
MMCRRGLLLNRMRVTAVHPEAVERSDAGTERTPWVFWLVLLLAALAGLLVRVEVGRKTYISFDEWQHIFMAGTARWTDLSFELRTNAHPPFFFLLLRGIVRLGNVSLYRSISIAAGAGSIVVVGLIARRILHSPAMQLLCATAFALSAAAISVSTEIRSYQLTVFLTLVAFLSWLDLCPRTDGRIRVWPCITFAISSSLAVLSHYSAIFFLGACVAVPFLVAAMSPRLRERWIRGTHKRSIWLAASALALPCAAFAVEYAVHVREQIRLGYIANLYIPDFHRGGTPNETAAAFVLRNSRNFLNLFSPIEFQSSTSFLFVIVLLSAAAIWVYFKHFKRSSAPEISTVPIVFAMVMVLELLVASLARKYPFGGLLRHQYIAGPFLLIAAFVFLDAVVSTVGPNLRRAIPALLLAAMVGNLIVEWPKLIVYPGLVLLKDEFNAWRSAFPDTHGVYLDHWAVIGYFMYTSDHPRRFVRRIPGDAWIDQYHVPGGTPDGTEIFYDKTRDNLDLSDSSVYRSFAACLRGSGMTELSLFYFTAGHRPLDQAPADLEKTIVQKAAEQGLIASKVVAGRTTVFAGFKLTDK